MRIHKLEHVQLTTDGRTVWVNGAGGCIARFGRNGIDIHRGAEAMSGAITECLFCTHTPTSAADWDVFVAKMLELHGVRIDAKFRPRTFAA
jgi:hypothetical protein